MVRSFALVGLLLLSSAASAVSLIDDYASCWSRVATADPFPSDDRELEKALADAVIRADAECETTRRQAVAAEGEDAVGGMRRYMEAQFYNANMREPSGDGLTSLDGRYAVVLTSDNDFGQIERLQVLINPATENERIIFDTVGDVPLRFVGWRDDTTAELQKPSGGRPGQLLLRCVEDTCQLEATEERKRGR